MHSLNEVKNCLVYFQMSISYISLSSQTMNVCCFLQQRPALQYDGLHDRALKHYFSQPEVRVQLTQLNTVCFTFTLYFLSL